MEEGRRKVDLKRGGLDRKIVRLIKEDQIKMSPDISLKKIGFCDIEFLWRLRNQPDVYKYFKNNNPVSWKEHINWTIPIVLGISDKDVFVIKKIGKRVGQVKFDYKTSDIGISILKEFRGGEIATEALALAIQEIKKKKKAKRLIAEIHKDNISSQKLFEKLSFKLESRNGEWIKYILEI